MVGRSRLVGVGAALCACAAASMLGAAAAAGTELDSSFAGDGTLTLPLSRGYDSARAAVASRDGSILVAANVEPRRGSNNDFAVVKLRDDGTPDPAFGTGGVARVDLAGNADGVNDLVELPDGRIVLAGYTYFNRSRREGYGFVRLLPDGQRDPSFGTGGVVIVPERSFGRDGECPSVNSLALTADGRIVAVGGVGCGGEGGYMDLKLVAMRLLSDGSLDPSFHGDGLWSSWAGCYAGAVTVLSDGGLLIAGATGSTDYCSFGHMRLIRLRDDGSYAADWQRNGRVTIPFPRVEDSAAYAMTIDGQGRVLLAGQADRRLALARVLADGSLDPSFGTGGRLVSRTGPRRHEYGGGVALAADGSAVVGVHSSNLRGLGGRFMVVRVTADGRLDLVFAPGGWQRVGFGASATVDDVVLDAAGRIVAVGTVLAERTRSRFFYDFIAARLR